MNRISTLIKNEHLKILEKAEQGNNKSFQRIREAKYRNMVQEELKVMLKEAAEKAPDISGKLETVRKKLIETGRLNQYERGSANHLRGSRPERRIPLETVSRMIEVPVNELTLFFLNGHRITEGYGDMYEYRLGNVYFYGDESYKDIK